MSAHDVSKELSDYFGASTVALALAEASGDNHLSLVNAKFCDLTGYTQDEVAGRNCRFLQKSARGTEAANAIAREKIHAFLATPRTASVRTPIINFKKDGTPFVNLLFMSKLTGIGKKVRFIFASQFDVSRSQAQLLEAYDRNLANEIRRLSPILEESGTIFEGTLTAIANSAATIAQAKLTLSEIEGTAYT